MSAVSGVALATDLIRLEIALWDRVDARLRESHELPLAFFESLLFISRAPRGSMRVGDLAGALRVTVGGTSKLAAGRQFTGWRAVFDIVGAQRRRDPADHERPANFERSPCRPKRQRTDPLLHS